MAGTLSFDSAYRAIRRGDVAPVYYVTGPEDVLKDELIALIREQVVDPTTRDFNVDVRSAADLDGESLHALVETPPMMAERRVVVVRGLEHWRPNAKVWRVLDRYLANPSPTTVLVLVQGAGDKARQQITRNALTVEVASLNPERLRNWVGMRAERADLGLEDDAVEHLIKAVGTDLSLLAVEIEKLAAAVVGEGTVAATDVAALVGIRRGETPYDWVAAVLNRNVPRAVAMLDVVLSSAGTNAVRLVTLLGTSLVGVRVARALLDRGGPGARLERAVFEAIRSARPAGLRSWREEATAWTAMARQWNAPALDAAIAAAYDADRQLKSTTISNDSGILTDMLLRLGKQRAAA